MERSLTWSVGGRKEGRRKGKKRKEEKEGRKERKKRKGRKEEKGVTALAQMHFGVSAALLVLHATEGYCHNKNIQLSPGFCCWLSLFFFSPFSFFLPSTNGHTEHWGALPHITQEQSLSVASLCFQAKSEMSLTKTLSRPVITFNKVAPLTEFSACRWRVIHILWAFLSAWVALDGYNHKFSSKGAVLTATFFLSFWREIHFHLLTHRQ